MQWKQLLSSSSQIVATHLYTRSVRTACWSSAQQCYSIANMLSSTSTILSLISIHLRNPTLIQPLQSHALTPVLFDLHIPLFLLSPYIGYGISPL